MKPINRTAAHILEYIVSPCAVCAADHCGTCPTTDAKNQLVALVGHCECLSKEANHLHAQLHKLKRKKG